MTRYNADIFTPAVPYRTAKERLDALTDEELIARLRSDNVNHLGLPELAWHPDEPEHEDLAQALRSQAEQDLNVLFRGYTDDHCNDFLAVTVMPRTGLPSLIVLFDNENSEDEDDWAHHGNDNPVSRLRRLRICDLAEARIATTEARAGVFPRRNAQPIRETPAVGYASGITYIPDNTTTTIQWTTADIDPWRANLGVPSDTIIANNEAIQRTLEALRPTRGEWVNLNVYDPADDDPEEGSEF